MALGGLRAALATTAFVALIACGGASSSGAGGKLDQGGSVGVGATTSGGAPARGGAATGGVASGGAVAGGTVAGGAATGVALTGGATAAGPGGALAGGVPTSGVLTGGERAGGATAPGAGGATGATAGAAASGASSGIGGSVGTDGGTNTGGVSPAGGAMTSITAGSTNAGGRQAAGGSVASGGTSGNLSSTTSNCPPVNPDLYAIGADITGQETLPAATRAALLAFLKSHGFNYVRLRTFVDPMAADGYDQVNGYDDIAHTVAFGAQVKEACLGLSIDFHYSDNWADPGKQCVPVAWQSYRTITDLAQAVYGYTKDSVTQLIAGGARPDMVQIGNEETPGILIHICDSGGLPLAGAAGYDQVNGAIYLWSVTDNSAPPANSVTLGGWTNLGKLLNSAAQGVKDVDASIKIALHLDRGNDLASSRSYIQNAQAQGVPFDVFGESCYVGTQGQPSDWQSTFNSLASSFPKLGFMIAEYSGDERAANDVIYGLPNDEGLGTFNWNPTTLWTESGTTFSPGTDMPIYDQMALDYASRL